VLMCEGGRSMVEVEVVAVKRNRKLSFEGVRYVNWKSKFGNESK
jgi:hypothetical protein